MDLKIVLEKLEPERQYAHKNYVPIIRDKSAEYLYNFVKSGRYKNVLEIGTAIGFSGSIILSAGAEHLTTIDINEDYLQIAQKTFEKFGYSNKVKILHGDAWEHLKELAKNNQKFDIIFLDGAKGQYIKYLPLLVGVLQKDGVIFADNVLLHGMVESTGIIPHKKRTMVVNLRKYLDLVTKDPYETDLIRLEDGIAITKLKGEWLC